MTKPIDRSGVSSPHPLTERLPDRWRYALLGGVLCSAIVVVDSVREASPGELSIGGLFAGGLLAGSLAARSAASSKDAGFRAGLAGFVPILAWVLFGREVTVVDVLTESWPSDAVLPLLVLVVSTVVGAAVVAIVIAFGVAGVVGGIGGVIGGWLGRAFAGDGSPATGGSD